MFFHIAREDALGIRERVTISKPNRINDGFQGPSPTQRAKSSIDEVTTCIIHELKCATSFYS